MAKNDFSGEGAENYEQKCLCVLVLDVSGSMNEIVDETGVVQTGRTAFIDGKLYNVVEGGVSKLDGLNAGLKSFYDEISDNETTSQRLEVAIITFNQHVDCIQEPALVSNFDMPVLEADGETALVDAVNDAIDLVEARKAWYKETNQTYYRPWIILMTDGQPDADQDIDSLAERIKRDTTDKHFVFLPIGVDKANMEVLKQLEGSTGNNGYIPAMKLNVAKFGQFFTWLSASMGTVVAAEEGQKVDFSSGADWMEAFSI